MKNLLKTSLIASLLWMAPLEQGLAQTSDNSIFFDDFDSRPPLPGSLNRPGVVKDPEQGDRAFSWKTFEKSLGLISAPLVTLPEGEHRFEVNLLAQPESLPSELTGYLRSYGFNLSKSVTGEWESMSFEFKTEQDISVTLDEFLRDTLGFANLLDGSNDVLFDDINLQTLVAGASNSQFQTIAKPKPKPLSYIRIGDFDGFGFGEGTDIKGTKGDPVKTNGIPKAANGNPINVDGKDLLASGDYLPDRNGDRRVAVSSNDNFDNRSDEELRNNFVTSSGFINAGSVGSLLTDVSLSKTYHKTFGTNIQTAHLARFIFNFFVDSADIDPSNPVFFNLIFGDYDVKPATIKLFGANGFEAEHSLTVNNLKSKNRDGLIQSAFSQLDFDDVFVANENGYQGNLTVEFKAPGEPYMAFDFVELSTAKIGTAPASVPEPSTILGGLAFGAFVTKLRQKRKQKTAN